MPIAEEIVPPRPNLGPEPWVDPPGWARRSGPWLATSGLLIALAWWRLERRRRLRALRPMLDGSEEVPPPPDRTPRRRMIDASGAVRLALIEAFGPGFGSKTTEEIAADPGLQGRADIEELVAFLRLADRAKFAGDESIEAEHAIAWADGFIGGLPPSKK